MPVDAEIDAIPRPVEPRWTRSVAFAILAVGLTVFVVANAPRLTSPFGDSHDGRNAGVWASGSRALREEGPIDSRLGGLHLDGMTYANHPPLIYLETAAVEAVAGEHPWSSKAPALLSTIAAVLLLYVVLVNARVRRIPAALGPTIGLLTPMLLVYGSMLDTPMTSLAFGVAVLWVWQRIAQGRGTSGLLAGALGALACLAGWEAMLLTWMAIVALVLRSPRTRDDAVRHLRGALPLLIGAALGTVLTLGWATWVYGNISTLGDQLARRSSDEGAATRSGALRGQTVWLNENFGTALLGMVACVVAAVTDRRFRPLALLVLVPTVLYTVVLYDGAFYHDYWSYWWVLPIAIGAGWGLNWLWSSFEQRGAAPVLSLALCGVLSLVVMVPTALKNTPAAANLDRGFIAGRLGADAPFDPSQGATADIGQTTDASDWLSYYSRLPYQHISTSERLLAFADDNPDALVLVGNRCDAPPEGDLCLRLAAQDPGVPWRIVRAGDLVKSGAG